ncbi:hypothetical protein [Geothrix sp. SG200]|uniref:hypothetical protein n=1 Tax=Geothrix sp. SG200 TaxID=2922865 RepID=UPI001FAD265D|nr:hypothetical protein [Geothrix sp. SG200]
MTFPGAVARVNGRPAEAPVTGELVELDGVRWFRVANLDGLPPFFMSLVSDSDHWLFVSSNGALTAGRRDPDHALFPYHADDRIHDSQEHTGSKTVVRVRAGGGFQLWEPLSQRLEGLWRVRRNLYKSLLGNRILFEEVNEDLGLSFRVGWTTSERFGFVRQAELRNLGTEAVELDLLDGIQNVLPAGLGWRFQLEYSTLGDGYKRTEWLAEGGLALFRLSSLPADKPEPAEALRVNVAWSTGLEAGARLLSSGQIGAFRRGKSLISEQDLLGRRGAFLQQASLELPAGKARSWLVVADVDLDAADVIALRQTIQGAEDPAALVLADQARGEAGLARRVAAADGFQATADERMDVRHISNTLFNLMRGGMPADGYGMPRSDFQAFLAASNQEVAGSHDAFLGNLPDRMDREIWLARLAATGDPDLERLAREYLPFTFSRRHGDPSRPWNIFSIQVRHPDGRPIFAYQGNWRDLFQNWEALAFSFPGYLEGMIFKFLNASTADGHNPYRVLREGFDWETVDPHDPWSFIGYWGDHQVIYLLKLLEASERYRPGALAGLLGRRLFTYADVPYRIRPYEALLADPRATIDFDAEAHRVILARAAQLGSDGKLLPGRQGLERATLAEKLLLVALAKLANFIPGAGIWLNTQRPEWNDANNALVGSGVSVVTLAYLRRYLTFCQALLAGVGPYEVSAELGRFFRRVGEALEAYRPAPGVPVDDHGRKVLLDLVGQAASAYRGGIYTSGFSGERTLLQAGEVQAFLSSALAHVDHSLRANRREDGLYHAYNLLRLEGDAIVLRRLYPMLEGQVAVLSSGLLGGSEAADLLDSLRASPLRRQDLGSYLLYPDRTLPSFLDKNQLPPDAEGRSELIRAMLRGGDTRLVKRDPQGRLRFNADLRSARSLAEALDRLATSEFGSLAVRERDLLLDLYEATFDHQSFTGRSGTFYKYEGLGCIYWHMVSKLRLAVDEALLASDLTPALRARLEAHAEDIREGLGVHRGPAEYGAIPTDPYSHTPGFAGAQQPGMTGQVKEDFLARFLELGVSVEDGRLGLHPHRIPPGLLLSAARPFRWQDVRGQWQEELLAPGSLAFTICQVLVVVRSLTAGRLRLVEADGTSRILDECRLSTVDSAAVFMRTGRVARLEVG